MEMRSNGLCGKFKLTNKADDQVDLTPGDIPDAGFSEEEIEKLTVAQLKFSLKCRAINQTGNKKEPLERCIQSGFARSISCLFSTTSIHRSLETCFHTKFAFSGSRTCKK